MDEEAFLRILRSDPDDDDARSAYWDWLEATDDRRAPFVRLMRQRLRLQEELKEVDSRLPSLEPPEGTQWTDLAFPIRIRSPMVGRCHTKRMQDAAPFVSLGSRVTPDTVVCLIEALSLFNEIRAGCEGVISEVTVSNGATVEYNQVLFRVSRLTPDFW